MNEESLKRIRLSAPADEVRDRILAAARCARRDQKVGRWISRTALAAITMAVFVAALGDRDSSLPAVDPGRVGVIRSVEEDPSLDLNLLLRPGVSGLDRSIQEYRK